MKIRNLAATATLLAAAFAVPATPAQASGCHSAVVDTEQVKRKIRWFEDTQFLQRRVDTVATVATVCDGDKKPTLSKKVVFTEWRTITRRPCATDEAEGVRCVWDARHMGNGTGRSFKLTKDADLVYISHLRAHRLTIWLWK